MFEKKSTEKVARLFFLRPERTYHLREIAREANVSTSTAFNAIEELKEKNLVRVRKKATKNVDAKKNQKFRDFKRLYNLEVLIGSGLVEKLEESYRPDALVLFGSYLKGEDSSTSDIDLAVVNGKETDTDLSNYEEELGRDLNVQNVDLEEIGENFRKTLANGLVLRGYLDI